MSHKQTLQACRSAYGHRINLAVTSPGTIDLILEGTVAMEGVSLCVI